MYVLLAGVLLWSFIHLLPALAPSFRQSRIDRFGRKAWRGMFSLATLVALALIVIGWRNTPENYLYVLAPWSRTAGVVLMLLSFLLIGAAQYKTALKRVIRHPMLLGIALWAFSHLLTNGTTRALMLFGGLGLWAAIEITLINRRDETYVKPEAPGFSDELRGVFISALIFMLALVLHPYYAGVQPLLF